MEIGENNMLEKMMSDLNEMNRLAQVYHDNEQWALLEKMMSKIKTWSMMIMNHLDKIELEVPETIKE
tara:strand:- start:318 stop:518 length:201 start_codon:yes stop_codon:yes gene_type:complete